MYGDSLDNKLLRFRTMTICRKYSLVRMETPSSHPKRMMRKKIDEILS